MVIKEGLSVLHNVGVFDGGKYPDLVEGVLLVLLLQVHDLDLPSMRSTFFMAYSCPSLMRRTLNTSPYEPLPNTPRVVKSPWFIKIILLLLSGAGTHWELSKEWHKVVRIRGQL